MKRAVVTGLLVIGAACLLLGCGKKEKEVKEPEQQEAELKEDEEEKKEEKKEEDEKEYQTIGTESEEAYKLLLTNHTGGEITQLRIKASSAPEFPENIMAADMKIPVQETVRLFYAPPEAVDIVYAIEHGKTQEAARITCQHIDNQVTVVMDTIRTKQN